MPVGVEQAKMIKSQITLLRERVLRTSFKARANPADDLWAKMAIRIKTAASVFANAQSRSQKKGWDGNHTGHDDGYNGRIEPPYFHFLGMPQLLNTMFDEQQKKKG